MPIIIIEGCDCAGKSTLAQELHKITGYEIVKGSSFEISQLGPEGMYKHMMQLLDRNNIIIDRFYLSNLVYGELYGYPMMKEYQFGDLTAKAELKALNVYVTAPEQVLKNRMRNRGDDKVKENEIASILAKYEEGMRNHLTNQPLVLRVDTGHVKAEKFASTVFELARMQERQILQSDYYLN